MSEVRLMSILRVLRESNSAWSRWLNGEEAGRGKWRGDREVSGNDLVADLGEHVEFATGTDTG